MNKLDYTEIINLKPGEYMPIQDIDPTGKSAQDSGAKLDAGKNRMGLVLGDFAEALAMVSKIGTVGANKYSDHGWVNVPNGVERYTDAMLRHYFEEASGKMLDSELTEMANEDILHAGCVAWNALARLNLIIKKNNETS